MLFVIAFVLATPLVCLLVECAFAYSISRERAEVAVARLFCYFLKIEVQQQFLIYVLDPVPKQFPLWFSVVFYFQFLVMTGLQFLGVGIQLCLESLSILHIAKSW